MTDDRAPADHLDAREFFAQLFAYLRAALPDAEIEPQPFTALTMRYRGEVTVANVENHYARYQAGSADPAPVFEAFLQAYLGHVAAIGRTAGIDEVVVVVKSRSYAEQYVAEARERGGAEEGWPYAEAYSDRLAVMYAHDTPTACRMLSRAEVAAFGLEPRELRRRSLANLERLYPELALAGDDEILLVKGGGGVYESSVLLHAPVVQRAAEVLPGDLLMAVPRRDVLLFAGADSPTGSARLRELAAGLAQGGPYLIDDAVHRWNGRRFEPLGPAGQAI